MDRQVLFPERDDLVPQPLLLARRSPRSAGKGKNCRVGLVAELMDKDPQAPGGISETSGRLGRRRDASTKKARRASYWRWDELDGSRNRRANVSRSLELSSMLPLSHPDSLTIVDATMARDQTPRIEGNPDMSTACAHGLYVCVDRVGAMPLILDWRKRVIDETAEF